MNLSIEVKVIAGQSINDALADAIVLARKLDVMIEFEFNGIFVCVTENSNVDEQAKEYYNKLHFKYLSSVHGSR